MKKFPFLLLDAGPIIGLVEMGLWDYVVDKCDVTVTRTVFDEAKYARQESHDVPISLDSYEEEGRIKVIDLEAWQVKAFGDRFDLCYQAIIDDGEKETLAFLTTSNEEWRLCKLDHAVYRVLGLLGKGDKGISLEEILRQIGVTQSLHAKYGKAFRIKYTSMGQADSIQGKGWT